MSELPAIPDDDERWYFKRFTADGVLQKIDTRTGEVVSEHSRNLISANKFKYDTDWSDDICNQVREGKTITEICSAVGYPPVSVVYTWRNLHPDFRRSLNLAREDRAEAFHDEIVRLSKTIDSRDSAQIVKVQTDILKWCAEKGNPAQYGAQTKITGDSSSPIGFSILNTGIQKETQEDVPAKSTIIETTCEEIKNEEESD